jgi:gamma-glutamyltranspeptidase/glutathione hydrolase
LQPAIAYARDGYPIHDRVAADWAASYDLLSRDVTAARTFLPDGVPLRAGDVHTQPALAKTLERIAVHGRDGFYTGPVADDMVKYLRGLGGLHTAEDFATARGEYVAPIKTAYAGHDVYECPPNGQGLAALEMLNILSGAYTGLDDPLSVERLHLAIEAARLAYRDRDDLIADPAQVEVRVDDLLSAEHAARLRGTIRPDQAMADPPPSRFPVHADTVYLSVVDRDRNAVSFINSIFDTFGSGLVSPKSGVLLQNRGQGFVTDPAHPNCIAPGKRPLHTIIPGMLVKEGHAVMPFGVMGGQYQAMGHAYILSNHFDFGLDLQEAIDLPRVFATPGGPVAVESGVPADRRAGLEARGHDLMPSKKPIGGAQAIAIDWQAGTLTGASDPRKDGCALGY